MSDQYPSKNAKVLKNKEKLTNGHSQEEPKETGKSKTA